MKENLFHNYILYTIYFDVIRCYKLMIFDNIINDESF